MWKRTCGNAMLLMSLALSYENAACAQPTFNPLGFGLNINESLLNPLESGKNVEDLTRQIAGILRSVHMSGGTTVRWFVTQTWPQYRCSRDPEDQATGELDPAWYLISRILLQQAQREGISVVVVMADTANGTFAGLPGDEQKRTITIANWSMYRQKQQGRDQYPATGVTACSRNFQNGYFGRIHANEIFEDPALVQHFAYRFLEMAQFLKSFPALGALEMFNEPSFAETQRPEFAQTIAQIRKSLYDRDPSLRAIPIYSGVASWNGMIAKNLAASGDLAFEPYINLHYYAKAASSPLEVREQILSNVAYLRRVAPNKPISIAEAGVADPVHDLTKHAELLTALLEGKMAAAVGMWMWGTFADDAVPRPDFKWEYSATALSGGAYRNLLIATDVEQAYGLGKPAMFVGTESAKPRIETVTIQQISDADINPLWRLRWQITVGPERFVSISRAGILMKVAPPMRGALSDPGSSIAVNPAKDKREWTEILAKGTRWEMNVYQCDATKGKALGTQTPPYLIEYAIKLGRRDFTNCGESLLVDRGTL